MSEPVLALLVPCLNEEKTIAKVIGDFKAQLPTVRVFVYDNGSTDATIAVAEQAGAIVRKEPHKGKGNVIRSMFEEIEADIYIMVDGDDTYPADEIHTLLEPVLLGEADMMVGNRLAKADRENFSWLHHFGNHLLLRILNLLFGADFKDMLSGYRVMNREFVKNIPLLAQEFEVETEMTIQALERKYIVLERAITYRARPVGSISKVRTFRDGYKILLTIFWILRDYRPMTFFPLLSLVFFIPGLIGGISVTVEFFQTGLVLRLPTTILSIGLILVALSVFQTGFIISTINRRFSELDIVLKKRSGHK
ncbi:MAG: glycosyltransferase [Candidatus Kerfeldbacteria bacterium]|nr:glycosyltransferase [Candidatus Kerfeldbacteria bacterium]